MVDVDQAKMAEFLRASEASVLDRWSETAARGVNGRISTAELRRELAELLTLIVSAVSGQDEPAAGQLRAVLQELSRSRARQGFSPSETAGAVFTLKEAVYALIGDSGELLPEYLAFSRYVDGLGTWAPKDPAAYEETGVRLANQGYVNLEFNRR